MEVGYTTIPAAVGCTEIYRLGDLPDGVCPCPPCGYVIEGAIKAFYPNTDQPAEVSTAGELHFSPAGHVLGYPVKTTALEFNPAHALQDCMDAIQRALVQNPALALEPASPATLQPRRPIWPGKHTNEGVNP